MLIITAPHFTVGLEVFEGEVIKAPPIVRYMIGWSERKVCRYCASKGWQVAL